MKLHSLKAELQMLKTLGSPKIPEKQRLALLGRMDKSLFYTAPARAAFNRFKTIAQKRMQILDFDDLQQDMGLEDDFKDMLDEHGRVKAATSKSKIKKLLRDLTDFHIVRSVYKLCDETLETLKGETIDLKELVRDHGERLANVSKSSGQQEEVIYNIGKGDNVTKLMEKVLEEPAEKMYKTGFQEYDQTNGGLPAIGLTIIASTTSGGKSVFSTNLLKNIHVLNKVDTIRISLEMTIEQEMKRIASMQSGVLFSRVKKGETTTRERKLILKAMTKWSKRSEKAGTRFSVVTPSRGMTVDDALSMVRAFNYKVICIDYIGLLEGMSGERQWQALGEAARVCKLFAHEAGCSVIILAQLDDGTDKLRYSKAMKEHADLVWQWNYSDPEVRAEKRLHIETSKARDGELLHFELEERYEYMQVRDVAGGSAFTSQFGSDSDEDSDDDKIEKSKKSRDKKSKKSKDKKLKGKLKSKKKLSLKK
jgi:replicative DNA helicase